MTDPPEYSATERIVSVDAGVPSVTNKPAIQDFLAARLASPLVLHGIGSEGAQARLTHHWWKVASMFSVDNEASFASGAEHELEYALSLHFELFEDELHGDAVNIDTWYWPARQAFLSSVRLFKCTIVDRASRTKHHAMSKNQTPADLRRASQSGNSYLSHGISSSDIGELARALEERFPEQLIDETHARLYAAFDEPIGYCMGEDTTVIAIEWVSDAVHAYPVTWPEVDRQRLLYWDS